MESVEGDSSNDEYDPNDVYSASVAVITAIVRTGGSAMIQSARISDMEEYRRICTTAPEDR
ncbi:hypothetical protein F444_20977 [Phytophthora nicotianae P1976]|uniref:Uncharacterized protein n=2 Tax=Phytophthora nicotianae TaxID=4792 RepID=A0A080Z2M9_PHYNI|nr:hypothetical protein F444_20977 [Phytophthora nicotianae P1976]